ncbi:Por secretion system C-terminal sorting domain-containing protein [Dyadobacter soli]|uniref:Por secretion system C-terminal sorting domain-containing protein n=1 Tax=Dyadobacter soli TaxID=659014 RepID=A0A1G7AAG7_9BACT|nr:T9SS type A sorting domain-containing protein [Dyadobacter soli]SDE11928.1 Por secretion system C-terminal sorting domain-containing protein [Dyadobacter soli]
MFTKNYLPKVLTILMVMTCFVLKAQPKDIPGPAGSIGFGANITVLTNGNYVVTSPSYSEGQTYELGAVYLMNGKTHEQISMLKGVRAQDRIGDEIYALPNGNFVVVSHAMKNASGRVIGAVTWGSGTTGVSGQVTVANSIIGTNENQLAQLKCITVLPSGNFVIAWPGWHNGAVQFAGAATWVNGDMGISGTVSDQNSLVGTTINASISKLGITVLTNGNYVVGSPGWATWADQNSGVTGAATTSNSLSSGGIVTALRNGNYVVASPNWDNGGVTRVGAVTWANGATGLTGNVSAANSIIGSKANDQVGLGSAVALSNGNYVFASPNWDDDVIVNAGAVTWVGGAAASTGVVSRANSLYGTHVDDQVGYFPPIGLTNGNYVTAAPFWDHNAVQNVGAVTWGKGATGTFGPVSESNSLYGTVMDDRIGNSLVPLGNGHYVVGSPGCSVNGVSHSGAVTWGNGTSGITGPISASNSLYGGSPGDQIGYDSGYGEIVPLTNGNYVVSSLSWHGSSGSVGALTWGNGTAGTSGVISSSNSLINLTNYYIETVHSKVTPLTNGNFVFATQWWTDNDPVNPHFGAIVWGNGNGGLTGTLNASNALLIPNNNQPVYLPGITITALPDGNYVASNVLYYPPAASFLGGAATWLNGFVETIGEINECNSIISESVSFFYPNTTAYNPVFDYHIYGRPNENLLTIFSPSSKPLGGNGASGQTEIAGDSQTPLFTTDDCQVIASLRPAGGSPVNGEVNAKVWVESTVPSYKSIPFAARHYEITPTSNADAATGEVTLFFSQSDFNNFNAAPGSNPKMPTGPADAGGISALRISKYPGTSGDGTGLPGSYSKGVTMIDPDDNDIIWNADFQRWEVTFSTTGFSGFVLHTYDGALPVRLVTFTGQRVEKDVELQWSIADASNFSHFEVERSTDARQFDMIGKITFDNVKSQYSFTDTNAFSKSESWYYRLKMLDIDGSYAYSKTLSMNGENGFSSRRYAYPVPMENRLDIMMGGHSDQTVTAIISNSSGQVLERRAARISAGRVSLDLSNLRMPAGIYLISIQAAGKTEQFRIVRK